MPAGGKGGIPRWKDKGMDENGKAADEYPARLVIVEQGRTVRRWMGRPAWDWRRDGRLTRGRQFTLCITEKLHRICDP